MSEDNSSERADLNQLVLDLAPHGESVAQLFKNELARAPWIVWSPERRDISHPLARRFYDRCETLPAGEGGIAEADVDLDHFGSLADWMTVVRVDPDSDKLTYAVFGQSLERFTGRNMTGLGPSDFGHSNSDFIAAVYLAVRNRDQMVLTEHDPMPGVFIQRWQRLIVPMHRSGKVSGFLCLAAPENDFRAGLEIISDPVFVMDADQRIFFVNRAGSELFDISQTDALGRTFFDISGISIEIEKSPMELSGSEVVQDQLRLPAESGLSDSFLVTIGATLHRGTPFYVLQVRMVLVDPASGA